MRGVEMEVFRELHVEATGPGQLDALIHEIDKSLSTGWTRDRDLEEGFRKQIITTKRLFCFSYDGDDRLPSATIHLVEDAPGRLVLPNIAPRTKYRLSIAEFNALLEEFAERFLRPCAERLGVRVDITSGKKELGHWLSDAAAAKFRRFSERANRRAGYLLPADRERWLEFLLEAHRERSKLDGSTLRRWLVEVEDWAPEVADQLAREYAFGEELLTFSESYRAGA
jgi:hypothetical protein